MEETQDSYLTGRTLEDILGWCQEHSKYNREDAVRICEEKGL